VDSLSQADDVWSRPIPLAFGQWTRLGDWILLLGVLFVIAMSLWGLHRKKPGAVWLLCFSLTILADAGLMRLLDAHAKSFGELLVSRVFAGPLIFFAVHCYLRWELHHTGLTSWLKMSLTASKILIVMLCLPIIVFLASGNPLPAAWAGASMLLLGMALILVAWILHYTELANRKKTSQTTDVS
jgi:uncharacterized membrane protein